MATQDELKKDLMRKVVEGGGSFLAMTEVGNVASEMPRYQSHKKVCALKIAAIEFDADIAREDDRETDGSAIITPAEKGYAPFRVDAAYVQKHTPKAGGYYVVYDDGYKSWSPADAFEGGYTLIVR